MPPPEEIDDDPFSDAADVLDRVQIPPIHSVVAFGSEEALESLHIPHGLPLDTILEQRSCSTLHTRQSGSAQSHLSHLRRSSSAPEGLGSASISQCSSRTTSQSLGKNVNQTRASIANQLQGSGPSEKEPESPTKPPLRSSQPTGREGQTLSHSPDLDRSHVNQDSGEARQSPGKRIRKLWHRIAIEKSNSPAARLWDELRTVRGAETACAPLYGVQKCTASVPHGTLIGPFQPETLGSTETRDGAASRHSGFLAQATDSTVDTNDRHTPQSKSHSTGQQSPPLFPHLVPAPLSISNKLCKRSKYSQDASNGSGDANTDCQQGSYDTTNGCTPSSCVDLQVDNGCGPRNSTSEATLYEDALASFGSDDGTAAHEDRAQGCSPSMSLDSLIAARSIHKRTLDKVPDTALGLDLSSPKSCSNSSSDDDPFLMFPTPPSPRHDQPDLKAFPLALQNVRSGTPQSPTRQSRNSRLARNTLQTHSTETQTKLDLRETRGQTGGQARVYGRCPHGRVLINSNTTNATEALLKSHTAKLPKYLVPRRALGCWRCQFLDRKDSLVSKRIGYVDKVFSAPNTLRSKVSSPVIGARDWLPLPDSSGRRGVITPHGIAYIPIQSEAQLDYLESDCHHKRQEARRSGLDGHMSSNNKKCWRCKGRELGSAFIRWFLTTCLCQDVGDDGIEPNDLESYKVRKIELDNAGSAAKTRERAKGRWRWSSLGHDMDDDNSTPERVKAQRPCLNTAKVRSIID